MMVFNNTVLPHPLSPITAKVWPRGIVRPMLAQHVLPAKIDAHLLQLDQRTMRVGDVGGGGDHSDSLLYCQLRKWRM